jgi:hypothetical protein
MQESERSQVEKAIEAQVGRVFSSDLFAVVRERLDALS